MGTSSESERISLVASALDLNDALGNDMQRLRTITEVVRQDPGVLDDLEIASARRSKVRQNQFVGSEVEKFLRELLEAPDTSLRVTRRTIGRDFEVDCDVVRDDGNEQAEIGIEVTPTLGSPFLIEVKASSEHDYRMTPKQAETAVNSKDRFVLCAVCLPKNEAVTSETVRLGARFVQNVGGKVQTLWAQYLTLETLKAVAPKKAGDFELVIEDSKVRFRVGKATWEQGLTFDQAVALFCGRNDRAVGT